MPRLLIVPVAIIALQAAAQSTPAPETPPPASSAAVPPVAGIPMLDERETERFNVRQAAAREACKHDEAACYKECNAPNEEACIVLVEKWAVVGSDNARTDLVEQARKLAGSVCAKATPRECARLALTLRALTAKYPGLIPLANESLAAACAREFTPACDWNKIPSGVDLPPEIAGWGAGERPFSSDPVMARCPWPVVPPKLAERKDPEYPRRLRENGIQGRVFLDVVIDPDGRVSEVRVTRSENAGFDASAIAAVKQWRYRPATSCGTPVATTKQATVIYKLGR